MRRRYPTFLEAKPAELDAMHSAWLVRPDRYCRAVTSSTSPFDTSGRRGGSGRAVLAAAVIVAVVSPAIRDHDSFPLSTYPVYATVRPRTATFATAFGESDDGTERRLPMSVIAATDDPLIAASRVADAVAAGRADELCEQIARRAPSGVVAVVVTRELHDVVEAARGDGSRLSRTVAARCRTQR